MKSSILLLAAITGWAFIAKSARADEPIIPGEGYDSARYEDLWKKSPFAVATEEAAPDSPDYSLVGIAQFDGVYYASVVDRKTQEHFLLTTDKPSNGMTLTSVTTGHNGSETVAVVQKDGQAMTLKLEQVASAAGVPGAPPMPSTMPFPGGNNPQIQSPVVSGMNPSIQIPMPGTFQGQNHPNMPRFRRPLIHLPPPPPETTPAQPNLPSAPPK
jgi:hypothetical protein